MQNAVLEPRARMKEEKGTETGVGERTRRQIDDDRRLIIAIAAGLGSNPLAPKIFLFQYCTNKFK